MIQPYQNQTALRDCPESKISNFINLFGEKALMLGDFAGFECYKLDNGNTELIVKFGPNVYPLRLIDYLSDKPSNQSSQVLAIRNLRNDGSSFDIKLKA